MFGPIHEGSIDIGSYSIDIIHKDVDYLNKAAQKEVFDITKLSFNAFCRMTETYQLLLHGAALGEGVGPLLVSKKYYTPDQINDLKIAIPGVHTTANLLL